MAVLPSSKRLEMLEEELKDYPVALDRDHVAKILDISRRKVDGLVEDGTIPHFVVDETSQKKQVKINKSDLKIYMLGKTDK